MRAVDAWLSTSRASFRQREYSGCRTYHSDQRQPLCAYSSPDDNAEEVVESPEQLGRALQEMSRIPHPSTSASNPALSVSSLEDVGDAGNEGVGIALSQSIKNEYPEYPGRTMEDSDDTEPEDGASFDGWFLDENDYINSSSHLNPDGSLNLHETADDTSDTAADKEFQLLTENLLRMQSPNVPSSFLSTNSNNEEPTLESLLQQTPQDPSATSEDLHRKVFEQEEGFLNQSEVFRKSLGTDGSAAAFEAARLRRGADYRRRQEQAISKLEQEIADFEAHLYESPKSADEKCFKCGCALSEEEMQHFRGMKDAPASRRLCSVCYGDLLVAKSDRSFFRDDVVIPQRNSSSSRGIRGQRPMIVRPTRRIGHDLSPPRRANNTNAPQSEALRAPLASIPPKAQQQTQPSSEMLQEDLQDMRDEFVPDDVGMNHESCWQDSSEESTVPWLKVIDPDTGEVFYWNEETEEMKWELE